RLPYRRSPRGTGGGGNPAAHSASGAGADPFGRPAVGLRLYRLGDRGPHPLAAGASRPRGGAAPQSLADLGGRVGAQRLHRRPAAPCRRMVGGAGLTAAPPAPFYYPACPRKLSYFPAPRERAVCLSVAHRSPSPSAVAI